MSFSRALQSFAFYLLSCSPCNTEIQRRRIKRDAKIQQENRAREREQSGGVGGPVYEQPSAGTTNPYWLEEFNRGPHTNRRKNTGASKSGSQRHLTSSGGDTASVGGCSIAGTTVTNLARNTDLGSNITSANNTSSAAASRHEENADPSEASIGRGSSGSNAPIAINTDLTPALRLTRSLDSSIGSGSSGSGMTMGASELTASRIPPQTSYEYQRGKEVKEWSDLNRSHTTSDYARGRIMPLGHLRNRDDYFDRRNPPVNDLHPPIVRQPSDRGASKWMVAPPPSAKVMERRNRDSSDSWLSRHYSPSNTRPHALRGDGQTNSAGSQQLG
ncbi:hypothetical protein F4861DRAFT_92436 [Xylaria intraflava]|nr:hypothetical protein F4861DRAFT_92436 [Xylaria intraflava]